MRSSLRTPLACLLSFLGAIPLATAQTVAVWNPTVTTGTANGTGSNFVNAANWAGGVVPGSTTAGSTTNTDTATFSNGQYANGLTDVAVTGTSLNIQNINFGATSGTTVSPAATYYVGNSFGNNTALNLTSGGAITATSNFNGIAAVTANTTLEDSSPNGTGSYAFTSNTSTLTSGLTLTNGIAPVASTSTTPYTLNLNGSSTSYLNSLQGTISGSLALVKSGSGTWVLDQGNNTYTGGTSLNGGTLIVQSSGSSLGTTGNITFGGNATLDTQGSLGQASDISSRLIIGQGVTATFNTANNNLILINGFGANGATGTATTGTGSLTKTGSGTLYLQSPESYTGTTALTGGTLSLSENTATAAGSASGADTAILNSASSLSLGGGTLNLALRNTGSAESYTSSSATPVGSTTLVVTTANFLAAGQIITGSASIVAGTYITAINGSTIYLSQPTVGASIPATTTLNFSATAPTDTVSQTVAGTAVTAGLNNITFSNNSASRTIALNLGTVTRSKGALLNVTSGTGVTTSLSNSNDLGGALNGVIYNSNDFAKQTAGTIGAVNYTTTGNSSNWTSNTSNYQVNTATAVTGTLGTVTLNALQLNTSAGFTLNQAGGTLSLNDGLIFGSNIGTSTSMLTGGFITAGTTANGGTNNELILINNNAKNNAVGGVTQIASVITDNGAPVSVDLESLQINSGTGIQGQLGIGGTSTTSGTVETYTGNTYVSGAGSVVLSGTIGGGTSAGTTYINGGGTLTIGNGGTTGNVIGGIQLDNGVLNFNRTDTGAGYTLSSTVTGTQGMGAIQDNGTGNVTVNVANNSTLSSIKDFSSGNLTLNTTGSVYLNEEQGGLKGLSTAGTGTIDLNSGTWFEGSAQATANLTVNGSALFEFSNGRGIGGIWNINNGGTVTFDGGNNSTGNSARFNFGINSTDSLTLGSGGTLNIYGSNYGFQVNANAAGTTIFNQTGGSLLVGVNDVNIVNANSLNMQIGNATAGQNGTYNLSGGTAVIAGSIVGSGTSTDTFTFTGGTLTTNGINLTNLASPSMTINGTSSSNLAILAPSDSPYYTGVTTLTPGTGGAFTFGANSELKLNIGGTTTAATQFHDLATKYGQIKVANAGASTNLILGGLLSVTGINGFNLQTGLASSTVTIITDAEANGISTASTFSNATTGSGGTVRVILPGDNGLGSYQLNNNGTTVTLGNYLATNYWVGTGTGSWHDINDWSSFIPANNSTIADFEDSLMAFGTHTATLDQNTTVRGLNFISSATGTSPSSFTIAQAALGSNVLTLDGSTNTATTQGGVITPASATIPTPTYTIAAGTATVTDSYGSQTIAVPVNLATNVATDVAMAGDTLTYSGVISGTGGMIANGPGTVVLSGNNTYTGTTVVNNGVFQVNGDDTAATGAVTVQGVASGTTALLDGVGTLGGAITVGGGSGASEIAPGNVTTGTIGTLTALSSVTAAAQSIFAFDINSSGAITSGVGTSDLLKVSGLLSLGTNVANLGISDLGSNHALTLGTVFELAQFGTESGTFTGLADSSSFYVNGNDYQVNYGTLSGYSNFLTLEAIAPVPEAKPWLPVMALALGLLLYRRWEKARGGKLAAGSLSV